MECARRRDPAERLGHGVDRRRRESDHLHDRDQLERSARRSHVLDHGNGRDVLVHGDQDDLQPAELMAPARASRNPQMKSPILRHRGFSIIELMVALTIGLIIVAAMLQNLTVASGSNRTNARVAEFQGNGRFATDFLRREIQHSGFAGVSWTQLTQTRRDGDDRLRLRRRLRRQHRAADLGRQRHQSARCRQLHPCARTTRAATSSCCAAPISTPSRRRRRWPPTCCTSAPNTCRDRSSWAPRGRWACEPPVADYLLHTDVYYISPWTNSASREPEDPRAVPDDARAGAAR